MSDRPEVSEGNPTSASAVAHEATKAAFKLALGASMFSQKSSNEGKDNEPPKTGKAIDGAQSIADSQREAHDGNQMHQLARPEYFVAKEGTTKLSTGDKLITLGGNQVLVGKDGNTVTVNKDGSIDVDSKDTVKIRAEGGKTTLSYPNGDSVVIKNGAIHSVTRDGKTAEAQPEKSMADKIKENMQGGGQLKPFIPSVENPRLDRVPPPKTEPPDLPPIKPIYPGQK